MLFIVTARIYSNHKDFSSTTGVIIKILLPCVAITGASGCMPSPHPWKVNMVNFELSLAGQENLLANINLQTALWMQHHTMEHDVQ